MYYILRIRRRFKKYWYLIFPALSLNSLIVLPILIILHTTNTVIDIPLYPRFVIESGYYGAYWDYDTGKELLEEEKMLWEANVKCLNLTQYIGEIHAGSSRYPWTSIYLSARRATTIAYPLPHIKWCGVCWIKPKIWPPKFAGYYQQMAKLKCKAN
jgi:hypothetical protein